MRHFVCPLRTRNHDTIAPDSLGSLVPQSSKILRGIYLPPLAQRIRKHCHTVHLRGVVLTGDHDSPQRLIRECNGDSASEASSEATH